MFNTKSATSALQKYILYLHRYIWWTHGCPTPGKGNLPPCLICDKAFNSSLACLIFRFRKQHVPNQTGQGLFGAQFCNSHSYFPCGYCKTSGQRYMEKYFLVVDFSEISLCLATWTLKFWLLFAERYSNYHRSIIAKFWVSLQKFGGFSIPSSSFLKLKDFLEQVFLQHISNYKDNNQHEQPFS